jgi:hypothetical protein
MAGCPPDGGTLQVPRYRRASAERREQLKWLYSGAAVFVAALLSTAVVPAVAGEAFGVGRATGQ